VDRPVHHSAAGLVYVLEWAQQETLCGKTAQTPDLCGNHQFGVNADGYRLVLPAVGLVNRARRPQLD